MKSYKFDNRSGDQRLSHDSGCDVSVNDLRQLGVLYYHFPDIDCVNRLAAERGYINRDEIIISPETMGANYEQRIRQFFDEHLHEDEEIRYIQGGQGYFDVRGKSDEWLRVNVVQGDLLILPAGIYHRFTPDTANFVHALRLFKNKPEWKPLPRNINQEAIPCRAVYIQNFL